MTTLWKVLAVLNGLFALLFFIFVPFDWGVRQSKAYPVFRRELAIHGLPVDERDTGWRQSSRPVARDLGTSTLAALFQNAPGGSELGGEPVKTQEEEVRRVQAKLKQSLSGLDDKAQRLRLRELLMDLADTGEARDRAAARAADPQVPIATLITDVDAHFTAALQQAGSAGESTSLCTNQPGIAHLLYNLSPAADWHSRVMVVIGLVAYARTADRQAATLDEMAQRVRHLIDDDRAAFEADYRRLVLRINELADQIHKLEAALKNEQNLVANHNVLIKERDEDVKQLTEIRDQTRQAAQAALAEQGKLEQELFQTQAHLARLNRENQKLVQRLRELELGQ